MVGLSTIFFVLLMTAIPCWAVQDPFDFPVDEGKLEAGELLLFEKRYPAIGASKKRQIAGAIAIDSEPARVWEVMKNWDELGQFVPDVDYYKTILVLEPLENGRIGESVVEGKLDIPFFDIQYTLDVIFDQSKLRQQWRMMTPSEINTYNIIGIKLKPSSNGIESIEGMALIKPFENGRKAIYIYVSTVEYTMPLPDFLEDYLARDALIGYLEAVKKRVESQGLYVKQTILH